jgi:dephospho-CoA kinase
MRDVANDLRKTHSPSYVIESLYERARQAGKDAVIESIRTIGEADYLKSHGALLLAVDADRQVRYERIVLRGSATDRVSFEQFCEQEDREMNAQDAWDMNVSGVMLRADSHVVNSGTRDELHAQIDGALEQIRK